MKVLGVGGNKFICEVDSNEVAALLGAADIWEIEGSVDAGDEIPLERAIKAAKWVRSIDNEHIDRVIKELQLTLTGVERVKQTASALNLFNRLSETHEGDE